MHWFMSMDDATRTIEAWRKDYNEVRPHSSLAWLTPSEIDNNINRARKPSPSPRISHPDRINFGGHLTPYRPRRGWRYQRQAESGPGYRIGALSALSRGLTDSEFCWRRLPVHKPVSTELTRHGA
jgi:hypothetical protein